jgi:hypothetical protein
MFPGLTLSTLNGDERTNALRKVQSENCVDPEMAHQLATGELSKKRNLAEKLIYAFGASVAEIIFP